MTDVTWTPVTVRLSQLTPWERNPKRISKTHAAKLLELWDEIGQFQTIAIGPAGEVYDGHQRLSVLKAAHGKSYEVDARQSSRPLTEKEREKLVIAAHVGTVGQFDWDALSGWDAGDLQSWGFDTETLTNWQTDIGALRTLLDAEQAPQGDDPGAQVDKAAELQAKWSTATGQMWALGDHRLIVGDCTDAATVARVMGGEKAALCVTSPPYADLREYATGTDLEIAKLVKMFDVPASLFVVNLGLILRNRQIVQYWDEYIKAAAERNLPLLSWNVWDKGNASAPAHQQAMFGLCHEWVFVFGEYRELNLTVPNKRAGEDNWAEPTVREKDATLKHKTHFPVRSHRQLDTVLRFAAIKNYSAEHTGHPAQFPSQFAEEYISAASNDGQLVADPFLGSGTTMVAAHKLGRRCFGIEIDPGYCAVTLERMSGMGIVPVLLGNDNGK